MTGRQVEPFDPDHDGRVDYLYIKLADHIAARVQTGELRPGARLPGERDLAVEYGVAIGTVRRATDELRRRGFVQVLHAVGTYVVGRGHAPDEGLSPENDEDDE